MKANQGGDCPTSCSYDKVGDTNFNNIWCFKSGPYNFNEECSAEGSTPTGLSSKGPSGSTPTNLSTAGPTGSTPTNLSSAGHTGSTPTILSSKGPTGSTLTTRRPIMTTGSHIMTTGNHNYRRNRLNKFMFKQ